MKPMSSNYLVVLPCLGLLACSDPPPQPPAIGLTANLSNPTVVTMNPVRACTVGTSGAKTYLLGQPNADGTIEDGKANTDVSCMVRADGTVNVTVISINQHPSFARAKFSMELNGQIRSDTDPTQNSGVITFFDPDTGPMTTIPGYPQCTIGKMGQAIVRKPGAMIADFQCPVIASNTQPDSGCSVSGVVAVEYCRTGEEDD